jgi:hypothetical protein
MPDPTLERRAGRLPTVAIAYREIFRERVPFLVSMPRAGNRPA